MDILEELKAYRKYVDSYNPVSNTTDESFGVLRGYALHNAVARSENQEYIKELEDINNKIKEITKHLN